MNIIERDITIPAQQTKQKIYIAIDGAEFRFENDCKNHERSIKYLEQMKDIPHKTVDSLDSLEVSNAYYIKNQEEYNAVIEYHECVKFWRISTIQRKQFENEDWYLFREDDIGDYLSYSIETLTENKKSIETFLKQFED